MDDKNLVEAIKLLGVYTAWRFDIWAISGNARASCRSHVMSVLKGVKTPQSKSGVNALAAEFHSRAGITGECDAVAEHNFIEFCRGIAPGNMRLLETVSVPVPV